MTFARISAAVLACSAAIFGLTSAVSAGPQNYCIAYAGQVAHQKTGTASHALVGVDEKWQGAYNKAFVSCMENYEPQAITSSAGSAPRPINAKLNSKPRQAKVSTSSTRSSKVRHSTKSKKAPQGKPATKSKRMSPSSRVPMSKSQKSKAYAQAADYCTARKRSTTRCKAKAVVPTTIKIVNEPAQ